MHTHRWFADAVVRLYLVDPIRPVPPSPGLDAAAVLHDAVAARARRRLVDGLTLVLLVVLALVCPVGVAVWTLVAVLWRRRVRDDGPLTRGLAPLSGPGALVLMCGLALATASTGFGIGGGAWWSPPLVAAAILLVLASETFTVNRLVRRRFRTRCFTAWPNGSTPAWERRAREFGTRHHSEGLDRVAAADERAADSANRADLIVHRGTEPFVGAGFALPTNQLTLSLKPSPGRTRPPTRIDVPELHAHVRAALVDLRDTSSSLVPELRLRGMMHREQVLVPADRLMSDDVLETPFGTSVLPDLDRPPRRLLDVDEARALASLPLEWARYHSCIRVESWNRNLATSSYLYAGTNQRMLFLELTHCVLPPIRGQFDEVDRVLPLGGGPLAAACASMLGMPGSVLQRVRSVLAPLRPRLRHTRGVDADRYGAGRSLREGVSVDLTSDHLQAKDAAGYIKIVDTALFQAVEDYLRRCGFDVTSFMERANTTIEKNTLNIANSTFVNSTIANNAMDPRSGPPSAPNGPGSGT